MSVLSFSEFADRFKEIGDRVGADKTLGHGYHRIYPLYLASLQGKKDWALLEIGYGEGQGILLWRELFPQAFIYCFDRDVSQEGEGYVVIQADQANPESMQNALSRIDRPLSLIVDDGSHHPFHQIASFSLLFEQWLEPSGFYIIEDIETSYWKSGELYGNLVSFGQYDRWSVVEIMKLAADYVNRKYLAPEDRNLLEYNLELVGLSASAARQIAQIGFGQNCIIAHKSQAVDDAFSESEYAYSSYLRRY
jgi:hypothetical protein